MLSRNLTKLGYLGRTNTQNTNIPFYDEGTPSLDLNFAGNKNLVDNVSSNNLVTFTRASGGTYVGDDGLIKTATTNEPRFDHNPLTGESLGLLVEEQRTNSIRNNTMVGAVAGTPGTLPTNWIGNTTANGVTREVIGTGLENGIAYLDVKYSGTPTSSFNIFISSETGNQIVAANGQAWTGSAYIKLAGGSVANIANLTLITAGRDSGGAGIAGQFFQASFSPTSSNLLNQRVVSTFTFSSASVAYVRSQVSFDVTSGNAIDITLRIGLPQLEQGAFATSVIPTSGTAVTRSADVASISGSNFSAWYRQDAFTAYVDARLLSKTTAGSKPLFTVSDGTATNRIVLYNSTLGSFRVFRRADGANNDAEILNQASVLAGVRYRFSGAFASTNAAATVNGAAVTLLTDQPMPSGIDRFGLWRTYAGPDPANAHIARVTFWPTRLSNTTLQNITR
jgi:hypothetical protein